MNKELANVNPLSERARGDVCVFLQRAGMYICNRGGSAAEAMHLEVAIVTYFDLSRTASFASGIQLAAEQRNRRRPPAPFLRHMQRRKRA